MESCSDVWWNGRVEAKNVVELLGREVVVRAAADERLERSDALLSVGRFEPGTSEVKSSPITAIASSVPNLEIAPTRFTPAMCSVPYFAR